MSFPVPCEMLDAKTRAPITTADGRSVANFTAVPRVGDHISFARQAWIVERVVFVDNQIVKLFCEPRFDETTAKWSYR